MADKIQYVQVAAPASDLPQQKVNEVGYLPPTPTNAAPTISLKEYFDSLIQEKEKRYEQRFIAQQTAVDKADAANEKRFESVNEFRNTLKDQQLTFASKIEMNTAFDYVGKNILKNQEDINEVRLKIASFITSAEYGLRHTELQLQITAIRDTLNTNQGKTTATDPVNDEKFNLLTKNIEALGIKIGSLQETRSETTGSKTQLSTIIGYGFGAISSIVAIILVILRFTQNPN